MTSISTISAFVAATALLLISFVKRKSFDVGPTLYKVHLIDGEELINEVQAVGRWTPELSVLGLNPPDTSLNFCLLFLPYDKNNVLIISPGIQNDH